MHRPRAASHTGLIALFFTAWIAANGPVAAQESRLVMTESGRHVLPAHVVVRGGALSPRGDASLFWSGDTVWIATTRRDEVRAVCPERVRAPLGAAFVSAPAAGRAPAIEIIDGGVEGEEEPRLIRFSDGECRDTAWSGPDLSLPMARDASGWVSDFEVPIAWSDSAVISVSSGPRGIIVSSRRFPFAWATAAGGGDRPAAGRVPAVNEPYYGNDPWIGTGVFALDSGFVQVLADLASDRRELVFYDSSGAFKRRRVIDVPFGILDTAPDRRQLLALRRTDRVEVLTYEWTWQPHRARK